MLEFPTTCGHLVRRAEKWHWSGLWRRENGTDEERRLLSDWTLKGPSDWIARVNKPQTAAEEYAVRKSIKKGRPLGTKAWVGRIAHRLQLVSSLRDRGRPKKRVDEADSKPHKLT